METLAHRKLISNSFDKLHEHLSNVRTHVEALRDPVAEEFVEKMEYGLLAPMRRLRIHLDIPYDWHAHKSSAQEPLECTEFDSVPPPPAITAEISACSMC